MDNILSKYEPQVLKDIVLEMREINQKTNNYIWYNLARHENLNEEKLDYTEDKIFYGHIELDKKEYLSDYDVLNATTWYDNRFRSLGNGMFLIHSPTGTGKSTQMINTVMEHLQYRQGTQQFIRGKALMLANRKGLVQALKDRVEEAGLSNNIHVMTYQYATKVFTDNISIATEQEEILEYCKKIYEGPENKFRSFVEEYTMGLSDDRLRFSARDNKFVYNPYFHHKYNVVVADEYHYICKDAEFNDQTDRTREMLEFWLDIEVPVYGTTATPVDIPIDTMSVVDVEKATSKNHIRNLITMKNKKEESILPIVEHIDKARPVNEKILIYDVSVDRIRNLYEALFQMFPGQVSVIASDSNENIKDLANEQALNHLIETKTLMTRITLTTKILAEGVDIIDKDYHHLILNDYDPVIIEQIIGRKRPMSDKDFLDIYYYDYYKKSNFNSIKQNLTKKQEFANMAMNEMRTLSRKLMYMEPEDERVAMNVLRKEDTKDGLKFVVNMAFVAEMNNHISLVEDICENGGIDYIMRDICIWDEKIISFIDMLENYMAMILYQIQKEIEEEMVHERSIFDEEIDEEEMEDLRIKHQIEMMNCIA